LNFKDWRQSFRRVLGDYAASCYSQAVSNCKKKREKATYHTSLKEAKMELLSKDNFSEKIKLFV
jgi:hypothetical protein